MSSPGLPTYTSSPHRLESFHQRNENNRKGNRSLKIINVNCRSLNANKETFDYMVRQQEPDIIIGTESWLSKNDSNNSYFPTDIYNVERRDRPTDPHGGVFIATKKDLLVSREETLETKCEIMWCKIEITGSKNLYVGAYYRPHEKDEESLHEMEISIQRLNKHHNIILGGDFNFPGWDWKNNILEDCNQPTLHYHFQEFLDDQGLTQLVEEPTRLDNTLDLLITSNPTLITKNTVVPGVSDHDCPVIEVQLKPLRHRQRPRNIMQYNNADWDKFRDHMGKAADEITGNAENMTVNELWNSFTTKLEQGIKEFIPTKLSKAKDTLPWVTRKIQHLIKRRDKISKKIKDFPYT